MKHLTQNCFIILIALLTPFISYSQGCMHEIPLAQQVNVATQIVEGKVLSQISSWNNARTKIYTIHTVEVYKVFKGESVSTIDVLTEGGAVGADAQIVTPSLELRTGEIGVFMLYENNISLESADAAHPKFSAYGSAEGFHKYDFYENKVTNPHRTIIGITSDFYDELIVLTGKNVQEVQPFSIDNQVFKSNNAQEIVIESMSPMTITSGTKSVLTINGSGFGNQQGLVLWADANSGGGNNFVYGVDSDVLSWTDTKIEVYVVTRAGSGEIGVEHTDGSREYSGDLEITVPYAHTNFYVNDLMRTLQHVDVSGDGGYIWHLSEELNANAAAKEIFIAALETWRCETGINWEIGAVTSVDDIGYDGVNIARFGSDSESLNKPARSTLSVFQCSSAENRYVGELDLTFNRERDWYFGTGTPGSGQLSFRNVVLHELGHSYLLNHVNNESDIMYYGAAGATQLGEDNLAGAAYVRNKSENIPICSQPLTTEHPDPCAMTTSTENVLTDFIEVFPNPVQDILYIKNNGETELQQITLYDAKGQQILMTDTDNYKSSYEINVSELAEGIYFLELTSETGIIVEKIIR